MHYTCPDPKIFKDIEFILVFAFLVQSWHRMPFILKSFKAFWKYCIAFFDAWFVSVVFGCCYGIVFILDIITNICTIFTYLYARSVQKRHTKKLVMLSTFVMHIFVTFKIHSKKYKDFSLYISCEKLHQTAFLFTGKALNWKLWVWFFFSCILFFNLKPICCFGCRSSLNASCFLCIFKVSVLNCMFVMCCFSETVILRMLISI